MFCSFLKDLNIVLTENNLYQTRYGYVEILKIINEVILKEQVKRIKNSKHYSIIIDESTDITSQKEFMIFIKYYDDIEVQIKTKFLKLIKLTDFTGKGKMLQDDDYYLYNILDTIKDLIKCLEDAYLSKPNDISGIYYQQFNKLLQEIDQSNNGVFKYHDVALHSWRDKENRAFLETKMIKVTKALVKTIISNLKHYFPEKATIKNSSIFDLREFIKKYSLNDSIYPIGNSELYDLC